MPLDEVTLYNLYNKSSTDEELLHLVESLLKHLKPIKLKTKKGYRFIKIKV